MNRRLENRLLPLLACWLSTVAAHAEVYNILDFGARQAPARSTRAIQNAVDSCFAAGGGTVLIPAGDYESGTIWLKSNIHLQLESGAVLRGSPDMEDYRQGETRYGLLRAEKARNITISGPGILNGNGTHFMVPDRPHWGEDFDRSVTRQGVDFMSPQFGFSDGPIAYDARPDMMLVILRCENVAIRNITFRDSPSWTMRIGDCDGVLVHGISILNNLLIPNSDGIHCTTSRNIRISDCDIRAGDDAIIVTGFGDETGVHGKNFEPDFDYTSRSIGNRTGFAENVTVTNCCLQSRSAGIRVGYGDNPIRNCAFQNLVIYGSNRGIGLFSRDRGSIENILFSDITIETRLHSGHWWGKGEPLHVSAVPQNEKIPCGGIQNIRFVNILARSETGIVIWGHSDGVIRDLIFENVRLEIRNGPLSASYGGNFDLRPAYPVQLGIFKHDIPGLFARFVHGLEIRNFDLCWGDGLEPFFTHGIEAGHVRDLSIDGFRGSHAPGNRSAAAVSLLEVDGVRICNSTAGQGTALFLLHKDMKNPVLFSGNDLSGADRAFMPGKTGFRLNANIMP
jgi:hypothetical protein